MAALTSWTLMLVPQTNMGGAVSAVGSSSSPASEEGGASSVDVGVAAAEGEGRG